MIGVASGSVSESREPASEAVEATVTNAAYWAPRALELASALSAGLTVVRRSERAADRPRTVAVVIDPAWWARQPGELADALGSSRRSEVGADDGRSPGAIGSGTDRLTLTVEEAAAVPDPVGRRRMRRSITGRFPASG